MLNPGGASVYSTATTTYNALDQATRVFEQAGSSGAGQETLMSYDGHGRLASSKAPAQTGPTLYTYYADDAAKGVTDARGAAATYTYDDNRHLVTGVAYAAPSPIPTPPPVSYAYDAAGNRKSMTDGSGTHTYEYDALSRLTSEGRQFAGLPGTYTLSYQYAKTDILEKITDQSGGASVSYAYNGAGQLTGVTGTGYSYSEFVNNAWVEHNVPTFASSVQYRAWGGLRDLDYGSGAHHHMSYDARLQASSFALSNITSSLTQSPFTQITSLTWNYDYYADGNVRHAYDLADNRFDRAYDYDHVGKLKEAYSGREARGEAIPQGTEPDSPYRMSYSYDALGHQLQQTGRVWWRNLSGHTYSYSNDRVGGWSYDAAGQVVTDSRGENRYDAAGERVWVSTGIVGGGPFIPQYPAAEEANTFDGDAQPVKTLTTLRTEHYESTTQPDQPTSVTEEQSSVYYLRSSALGGYVVAEMDGEGRRTKAYVYAGGRRLAEQTFNYSLITSQAVRSIKWQTQNPVTGSWVETSPGGYAARREMDARGAEVGAAPPAHPLGTEPPPSQFVLRSPSYIQIEGGQTGEMELGMQAYEDFYLNKKFGKGAGPGESYRQVEDRLRQQQAMGAQFLFGLERMQANMPGGSMQYERVDQYEMRQVNEGGGMGLVSVSHSYRARGGMSFAHAARQKQPQNSVPTPTPEPCDVQAPTDPNDNAVAAVLLGEATDRAFLGTNQYTIAQSQQDYSGRVAAFSNPQGEVITMNHLRGEMYSMVSTLVNRFRDPQGRFGSSWQEVATQSGQFAYNRGLGMLNKLGAKGSENCEKLRMALEAIQAITQFGVTDSSILYWKAVRQGRKPAFIRPWEEGDRIRFAHTDFSINN
ncbi:MAG: hypothetical protein LC802_09995 [Acidobacteria bacterium]|nr:hypothetical protein [Acidobacteriota bacterium]